MINKITRLPPRGHPIIFVNHSYDHRPNWTTLSPITIINWYQFETKCFTGFVCCCKWNITIDFTLWHISTTYTNNYWLWFSSYTAHETKHVLSYSKACQFQLKVGLLGAKAPTFLIKKNAFLRFCIILIFQMKWKFSCHLHFKQVLIKSRYYKIH